MCRSISLSKETKPTAERLGDGEQIKAKGEGKGGWQTRKRDGQPGRVRWTGITCKPLFPGEPPMRALSTGQDARRRRGDGEGSGWVSLVKHMVSLRTTLSHSRRMLQRGQSFHCTVARGGGRGASTGGGEEVEGEEESGHSTALTRRGLIVALLS